MCKDRLSQRATHYRFTWLNKWFMLKLAILSIGWYMCVGCMVIVSSIEPLKTFIPHEILGIASDAPVG